MKALVQFSFLLILSAGILDIRASEAANYKYTSLISLPQTTQPEELVQAIITPEIFKVTRDNLADLRIVRSDNQQSVPCLVECVTSEQLRPYRRQEDLKLIPVIEPSNLQKTLIYILTRSEGINSLMGLTINTPLTQFEQFVDVEVSNDQENWTPIIERAHIFDYKPFANVRKTDIPLPNIREKYLRVTFANPYVARISQATQVRTTTSTTEKPDKVERTFTEEKIPFQLTSVTGWLEEQRLVRNMPILHPRNVQTLTHIPSALANHFPQKIILAFDAQRSPLEYLKLTSLSSFLNVAYELYIEQPATNANNFPWKRISNGTIERINFRNYQYENMTLSWSPTTRASRYALVFSGNTDDATTLSIQEARGPDYRIVFPYRKGEEIELLAGNPDSKSVGHNPRQIASLMLHIASPIVGTLGMPQPNPLYGKTEILSDDSPINMTIILTIAIILAVVVLGFAVFKAMQRMPSEE